ASAAPGPTVSVVGFSDDGTRFAVVLSETGAAKGKLKVWETGARNPQYPGPTYLKLLSAESDEVPMNEGKPVIPAETLARWKLGNDPGTEQYKSGTKVQTSFTVGGAPLQATFENATMSSFAVVTRGQWCRAAAALSD